RVPVLLVRPHDGEPTLGETRPVFAHVVVALDGSVEGEHSVESVLSLALPATRLTLLRVVTPPHGPTTVYLPHAAQLNRQLTTERLDEAAHYLAGVEARVRSLHEQVESVVVLDYHPATAIVRWAEEHGADGIAMSTHGRAPALRLLLGSTASRVVRGGQVPVLVG